MQNKANFRKSQMNVNKLLTKDYENETLGKRGKKQSQTKPNKAKFKKAKMNVTSILTVGYENKSPIRAPKKQSQISKRQKPMQTSLPQGIMKITALSGPVKTNPKQTQSLVKDLNALVSAWMFISKTAKNSCARLWALLQCFSENFDKPGERKAECSARPKLRTDPMNLLGIMPAKEGKIDLKHSFYGSAFYFEFSKTEPRP